MTSSASSASAVPRSSPFCRTSLFEALVAVVHHKRLRNFTQAVLLGWGVQDPRSRVAWPGTHGVDQPEHFLHGSLNFCVIFNRIDALRHCIGRQSWTGVGLEGRREQRGAALDALSLWSIWSRSRINECEVKSYASKKRGVWVKPFDESLFINLRLREAVPARLRRIVVTQTTLHQPEPWHERIRREVIVRCHQRGLVGHCPNGCSRWGPWALMYSKRPLQTLHPLPSLQTEEMRRAAMNHCGLTWHTVAPMC